MNPLLQNHAVLKFSGLIASFVLLFTVLQVTGQQMNFVNISAKLGLPAAECYNVLQDSKGYIWICTEAGLCRYNGNDLEVFDKNKGLPERNIYASLEAEDGTLWFLTSKNRILQYKNNLLTEAPFSKSYQSKTKPLEISYAINQYATNELLVNTYSSTFKINLVSNTVSRIERKDSTYQVAFEKINGQLLPQNGLAASVQNKARPNNNGKITMLLRENGQERLMEIPATHSNNIYLRYLTCKAGNSFYFCIDNKIFAITDGMEIQATTLKSRIISLYCDKYNGLWAGTFKNGVTYFAAGTRSKPISLLGDFSVSGICEDHEGNTWFSTLEKGVFICRNKNVISFTNIPQLDRPVEMLKTADGIPYASAGLDKMVDLNTLQIKKFSFNAGTQNPITDFLRSGDQWIITCKTAGLFLNSELKRVGKLSIKSLTNSGFYKVVPGQGGQVFMLGYSFFSAIESGICRIIAEVPSKAVDACYIGDSNFLIGCTDGLYAFHTGDKAVQKIAGINKLVNKIFRAADQSVWIATKEEGLYQFRDNKLTLVSNQFGLHTDVFYDIAEDKQGNLWLGTNTGLAKIPAGMRKGNAMLYTTSTGLPANEVFKVAVTDQYVFISTVEGISRMPVATDSSKKDQPPIYLHSCKVNGMNSNESINGTAFAYNKNNFEFDFNVLSFDFENKAGLLYNINDSSAGFTFVKGTSLKLDNLEPGAYQLIIYGVSASGIKSAEPVVLNFSIKKPFWKTWLFITVAAILAGACIFFLFSNRIRHIQKKAEEKTKLNKMIADSQLFALQAQMNPHFIFNSINSIQHFILEKREKDAYSYLAKFSRLIRTVLNNSEKLYIALYEEIDTLKNYIELEQLRFENKFDYELVMGAGINEQELFLPPMLVQPYVENAIWHGLLNLGTDRKGKLWLHFALQDDLLKITIQDNGIGRQRASLIKKENVYTPVAMNLTEKRLQVVHTIWGNAAIKVTVKDLYDEAQQPTGTSVEIFLPLNMQEDEKQDISIDR